MNVTGQLQRLGGVTLTVTRTSASSPDANGRAQAPATSSLSVVASVQPLSGRDVLRLPEGLRAKQVVKIYTETPLQTPDQGADQFSWNGSTFEVRTVEPWNGYYQCIAERVPS